jgi:hypothetical protein
LRKLQTAVAQQLRGVCRCFLEQREIVFRHVFCLSALRALVVGSEIKFGASGTEIGRRK